MYEIQQFNYLQHVILGVVREREQPQHACRATAQHARPQRKRIGVDLVQLIEVGEDNPVLGQRVICSRDRKVGRDVIAVEAGIVVDLIGAGHEELDCTAKTRNEVAVLVVSARLL